MGSDDGNNLSWCLHLLGRSGEMEKILHKINVQQPLYSFYFNSYMYDPCNLIFYYSCTLHKNTFVSEHTILESVNLQKIAMCLLSDIECCCLTACWHHSRTGQQSWGIRDHQQDSGWLEGWEWTIQKDGHGNHWEGMCNNPPLLLSNQPCLSDPNLASPLWSQDCVCLNRISFDLIIIICI